MNASSESGLCATRMVRVGIRVSARGFLEGEIEIGGVRLVGGVVLLALLRRGGEEPLGEIAGGLRVLRLARDAHGEREAEEVVRRRPEDRVGLRLRERERADGLGD